MNTIQLSHAWMRHWIHKGDFCIDATAGRGNDTTFLCELVGETGKVIAFDVQEEALKSTKLRLEKVGYQAELYLENHINMAHYVEAESVAGMMFNFGYLPGGDHTICTHKKESICAIRNGLTLLKIKGVMSLCIYHGGDTGFEEKEGIMSYLKTLDPKQYTVLVSEFYNQINYPPIFAGIIKNK